MFLLENDVRPWLMAAGVLLMLAGCRGDSPVTTDAGKLTNGGRVTAPISPNPAPPPKRPEGLLPHFTDVAQEAGVDFRREDDIRGLHRIMEANGGGVAMFDYDGDGRLDLFFTNGCRLPLKERTGANTNEIYRQVEPWRYQRCTQPAGLTWDSYCYGCAVADYDSDGFDDLYVTAYGENRLYRNNGDGTFADVTEQTGTQAPGWGSSAAFADLNGDGNLDLFVVNYVDYDDEAPHLCPDPASPDGYVSCPPTMFASQDDFFFLSDGSGGFIDASREAGVAGNADGKGLGVVIFDADRDGWPDIYVANDGMANYLYKNRMGASAAEGAEAARGPMPRFSEEAALRGAAVDDFGVAQASMGVAHGDVDGDGWIDLFLTHFHADTNTLYRNREGQSFEDASRASGLGPPSRQYLGFGTEFLDFDNDGWLDLFVANGHIDDLRWHGLGEDFQMHPQFFRNRGKGQFDEVTRWSGAYFEEKWLGRGVAVGDLDDDGDLDLAVSHQLAPSAVLRNDTETPHPSVVLRLVGGMESNRSAIGARVEAAGGGMSLVREVVGGGSYQSASDRRVHLGCGAGAEFDSITVRWPSGAVQTWRHVEPGAYVLREGDSVFWTTP